MGRIGVVLTIVALIIFMILFRASNLIFWLFSNVQITGSILLLVYIIPTIISIYHSYKSYHVTGVVCAFIHAIFPPIVVIVSYLAAKEALQEGVSIFSFAFNWFLVFLCLLFTSCLAAYSLSDEKGLSHFRLLGFTVLNVLVSIQLIGMIHSSGF